MVSNLMTEESEGNIDKVEMWVNGIPIEIVLRYSANCGKYIHFLEAVKEKNCFNIYKAKMFVYTNQLNQKIIFQKRNTEKFQYKFKIIHFICCF